MHSVTDRQTDGQTDGQQAAANSRSYCVAVRSAKNEQPVYDKYEELLKVKYNKSTNQTEVMHKT